MYLEGGDGVLSCYLKNKKELVSGLLPFIFKLLPLILFISKYSSKFAT